MVWSPCESHRWRGLYQCRTLSKIKKLTHNQVAKSWVTKKLLKIGQPYQKSTLHLAQKKLSRPCYGGYLLVSKILCDGRLNFFKPSFIPASDLSCILVRDDKGKKLLSRKLAWLFENICNKPVLSSHQNATADQF